MTEGREHARELLIDELKQAVGEETVERADLDVDRAIDNRPHGLRAAFVSSRLLLVVIGAALVTAGVIASIATGSWVWFGVAIGVHALFSVAVIATALATTTQVEKPAPTTVGALTEAGVADPEGALNDLVEQATGHEEGSRVERSITETADTRRPNEDPGAAAAAQQSATTPASEPTRIQSDQDRD